MPRSLAILVLLAAPLAALAMPPAALVDWQAANTPSRLDMAAFYSFSDGTKDFAGSGWTGTLGGGASAAGGYLALAAATTGRLEVAYSDAWNDTEAASISLWHRGTNSANVNALFCKSQASATAKDVLLYAGGNSASDSTNELFTFGVDSGAAASRSFVYETSNPNEFFDGAWHHLVVTADGSSWKMYLDGVRLTTRGVGDQTSSTGDWIMPDQTHIRIGGRRLSNAESLGVTGDLDLFRFYRGRVLSDEDVTQLYLERPTP